MRSLLRDTVESPIHLYLRQIQESPLLTAEEERLLARRILDHNCAESRDRMIRSNLRLVVAIAKRYAHCGLPLGDLIEEGNLGLVRAVESFDPDHGARFSTYGSWWIKQSIRRALMNCVQPVRIPAYMVELVIRWNRTAREKQESLGRAPTPREIGEAMGLPPRKTRAVRAAVRASQRLAQAPLDNTGRPLTLTDSLPDDRTPAPGAAVEAEDQLGAVRRFLSMLNDRESTILRLRYGLDGAEPLTLKEVGQSIGLTRERVRQLEIEALKKLNRRMTAERIFSHTAHPLRASA